MAAVVMTSSTRMKDRPRKRDFAPVLQAHSVGAKHLAIANRGPDAVKRALVLFAGQASAIPAECQREAAAVASIVEELDGAPAAAAK